MSIARDMAPKRILGMDIDNMLISKARKLLKQYANTKVPSGKSYFKTGWESPPEPTSLPGPPPPVEKNLKI